MSVNIKTENGLVKVAGKVNSFPVSKISSSDYLEDSPIGTVISFMGTTAPAHYLVCDGTVYNIADYSALADFIQTQFGSKNYFGGDGTTTFAVPDLDNEFEDSISCIKYESTYFMQITDVGYSTSEVYTGKKWIDGKPIYRRVIEKEVRFTDTNWTDTEISADNIEQILNIVCCGGSASCHTYIAGAIVNNNIVIRTTRTDTFSITRIILEYTKTTD